MARLGDVKTCRLCGDRAMLRLVPESTAGPVGVDGALPQVMPPYHAWECKDCGYREPFNGTVER